MILLFNVFITEDRLVSMFDRGNLSTHSRFDVVRYSLSSLAMLPLTKAVIFIQLSHHHAGREEELEKYVYETFKCPVIYSRERMYLQSQWQKTLTDHVLPGLPEELVWFLCNDDHIFLPSNLNMLNEVTAAMDANPSPWKSCYISHLPEMIGRCYWSNGKRVGNHLEWHWQTVDSIQLLTKEMLQYTWFEFDYGEVHLPRTDWHTRANFHDADYYVGLEEFCRHYDGYGHTNPGISNNDCPALTIPDGFFTNSIKIRYGFDDYREGWVNVNPLGETYYAAKKGCPDYLCCLNELPMFWDGHIAEIECMEREGDIEASKRHRNRLLMSQYVIFINPEPYQEWLPD